MTFDRIEHAGGAVATTLAGDITSSALTLTLADPSGWPTGAVGAFYLVVGSGTASEEKIQATSRVGAVLSGLARGVDGSAAQTHSAGETVYHGFVAAEADEANQVANMVVGQITNPGDSVWGTGAKQVSRVAAGVAGAVVQFDPTQPAGVKMDYVGPANIAAAVWGQGLSGSVGTPASVDIDPLTMQFNGSAQISVKAAGVGTAELADLSVATAKIVDGAVTSAKILDGTIATADLADASVTPAKTAVIPHVRLTSTLANACLDNTPTLLSFDVELQDTNGMHAPAQQGRILIVTPGIYLVSADVRFQDPSGTAGNLGTLAITINGGGAIARDEKGFAITGGVGVVTLNCFTSRAFIANDFLQVSVTQQSGGTLNPTIGTEYSPIFTATWVGPAV